MVRLSGSQSKIKEKGMKVGGGFVMGVGKLILSGGRIQSMGLKQSECIIYVGEIVKEQV